MWFLFFMFCFLIAFAAFPKVVGGWLLLLVVVLSVFNIIPIEIAGVIGMILLQILAIKMCLKFFGEEANE